MYRFEGTEIRILVFIIEGFLKKHSFFTTFLQAYFSFITSLKNAANVVLSSLNWFSWETATFVMRMCLKMMFLFPKIMWFLQKDSCEGDYPKNCNISLSNNIQMVWVAYFKTDHFDVKK